MKHEMRILDQTGHTTINWNTGNETEVAVARAAFNEARTRGLHAFHVTADGNGGSQGRRMTDFDPAAEKMMLMPQLRGG